ncbi:MAG: esterase-like activity of phytase family protein [Cyanobacteria bacterium J06638_28]
MEQGQEQLARDLSQPNRMLSSWAVMMRYGRVLLGMWVLLLFTGCTLPQISAEERIFLPITVELLDVVTLPRQTFEDTVVGGLSALTYDRSRDVFYALSDDRGSFASPRFYTLAMSIADATAERPQIGSVSVSDVTLLRDATGEVYERDRLDTEGIVLSPRQTLFISSEGVANTKSPPALNEYNLETGRLITEFRIPDRFLPSSDPAATEPEVALQGIRSNQGFEALALGPTSSAGDFEPFRLFMATESALAQDFDNNPANPLTSRFLHYLISPEQSTLIAEHAYPLSLEPTGAVSHGLTELVAIDAGGHFLALERAYGIRGFDIKLFQLATGGATDISTFSRLVSLEGVNPIRKQPLLDFATLDTSETSGNVIQNLEGMTLGPGLPNGAITLWIISDDNFADDQTTQIWLFRLQQS